MLFLVVSNKEIPAVKLKVQEVDPKALWSSPMLTPPTAKAGVRSPLPANCRPNRFSVLR